MLPNCHRCGDEGHWANQCPTNEPATSPAEHRARIASILKRWENWETTGMTTSLKRRLVKEENDMWNGVRPEAKAKLPAGLLGPAPGAEPPCPVEPESGRARARPKKLYHPVVSAAGVQPGRPPDPGSRPRPDGAAHHRHQDRHRC